MDVWLILMISCIYSLSGINFSFGVSWNNSTDTFQMPTNGFIHFVIKDDNNIDTVVWDYNDVSNTYFVDIDFNPLTPDELKIIYFFSECGCLINDPIVGSIFDQYIINPIFISVCDTIPI